MGSLPEGKYSPALHHAKIINHIVDPSFARRSLVRSYQRSFNGFTAYISEQEREKLARYDGVVSVFPCQKLQLLTTSSWDFMGVSKTIERSHAVESDTIVGVIDSGIWPESESFSDEGFGLVPSKWKGVCNGGRDFVCNRKIIGARSYILDANLEHSAKDTDGHGTHVSSIIAGNEVNNVNYYGLAYGVARGGVPSARLAAYKVCHNGCPGSDILMAFDDAIADGVDIISISINSDDQVELTSDPIAIGAFHGIKHGILTVNSGGNCGPGLSSIRNYAPWLLTVAASETDRKIFTEIRLGKDVFLTGNGINAFPSSDQELPLVYGKDVSSTCSKTEAGKCVAKCLERSLVENKVVLCDQFKTARALGCIMPNLEKNVSMIMPYPVVGLSENDLNLVRLYKKSTMQPQVQILKSEVTVNPTARVVAVFSSRGPSVFMPDIIKPDITAPGVEIIVVYSPMAPTSEFKSDKKRNVTYNILSGTSMSCPHVSAAATLFQLNQLQ